jgi:hypothetical protein
MMSEMAEMAMVMARVKQAIIDSGEVVSSKEYERLATCVKRMLSITEECINRIPDKEASFKRDVRVYMNVVRDLVEEPFFGHARFTLKTPQQPKEEFPAEKFWKNHPAKQQYDRIKEEQKEKKREYKRAYMAKYRAKKKAEEQAIELPKLELPSEHLTTRQLKTRTQLLKAVRRWKSKKQEKKNEG